MCEDILREVAAPLQLDTSDWSHPHEANDPSYKEYTRLLRRYDRIAWQHHVCAYCNDPILSGEWYEAYVYVSKKDGEKSRVWVAKRHYPDCPGRLEEIEEEMRRRWAEEDRVAREKEREAA